MITQNLDYDIHIRVPQKLIIHKFVYYETFEAYMPKVINHRIANGGSIPHLFWVDGFVIDYGLPNETELMQKKEYDEGEIHYTFLIACKLEKFVDKIEMKNGGHFLLSDVSIDPFFKRLASFLKRITEAEK